MRLLVILALVYLVCIECKRHKGKHSPKKKHPSNKDKSNEYCDSSLCPGSSHIACNNDGEFGSSCKKGREVVDLSSYQKLILDKHNTYRNRIAGGEISKFEPASRMATMVWNDELAKFADLNVKTCVMEHDQCHNTKKFKWTGQNIAWRMGEKTVAAAINGSIDSWFKEYENTKQANIDKFRLAEKTIGHFTAMVNDRATAIGCGLLRQPAKYGKQYIFTCNYSQTNILNYPIYKRGKTASKCKKGPNPDYPNLCSPNEPIDPNSLS